MKKEFKEHFNLFLDKVKNKENFAFARFSDGELFILQNKELKLDDNYIQVGDQITGGPYKPADFKHFDPKKHSFYRNKLIESFLLLLSFKPKSNWSTIWLDKLAQAATTKG